jgi:TPR repeat protein
MSRQTLLYTLFALSLTFSSAFALEPNSKSSIPSRPTKAFFTKTEFQALDKLLEQRNVDMTLFEQALPQDSQKVLLWYLDRVEGAVAEEQYHLSSLYYYGDGVPKDYQKASYWFKEATEPKSKRSNPSPQAQATFSKTEIQALEKTIANAYGQFLYGLMYDIGLGVPLNYPKALYWYQKAAEQGDADAQLCLGVMHDVGKGVPQDYQKAYQWFSLASSHGTRSPDADEVRDVALSKLNPSQIAEAESWIKNWKPKPEKQSK